MITCAPNMPDGIVYEGFRNPILPKRETIDGVEVVRVWSYIAANSGTIKRTLSHLSYMVSSVFAFLFWCRRPSVILATSPHLFAGCAGVIASYLKLRPLVVEIRDIWPESIVTLGALKKGIVLSTLELLERWIYRSADHIVAVGQGYADNIQSKVDVDGHISVVTNGVDIDSFTPTKASESLLEEWNLSGKFVCAYVGTTGMAHGLEVTIEAAKKLREMGRQDIVFWIVGSGSERERLMQLAKEEELSDYICFSGRLPKSQMNDVLASSNCVLVHLRKTDLFETVIPSKIFEAMAMCRPIIMGVRGESLEIVKAAGCGLEMPPEDADALVECTTRLADDQNLQDQLSRAREFVGENYSRDVLAKRMENILQQTAKGC